jgi:signal transduction histidine kinase/CBS domain-containing protein
MDMSANIGFNEAPALEQIQNQSPLIVTPETSLTDVLTLINQSQETDCVLVVEAQQLVGIFTASDGVRQIVEGRLEKIPIEKVMTQPVITLKESEYRDIFHVLSLFKQHQICHLPILNREGKLRGLITQDSLLQSFAAVDLHSQVESLQQEVSQNKLENQEILQQQVQEQTAALSQQMELDRILSNIADNIRRSLNIGQILNTTVTEIKQLLQVHRVVIYRFNPDWSGVIIAESVGAGWLSILGKFIDDSCFSPNCDQSSYHSGKVRVIYDIYTAEMSSCHRELLETLQVRAKVLVPILLNSPDHSSSECFLWGLLIAHSCGEPRHWLPHEIQLLEKLAVQISIAIQQSELYHQLEVLATQRTLKLVEKNCQLYREIKERGRIENALKKSNDLLQAIREVQSQFIANAEPRILFEILLENLLNLTESEYGFMGEILYTKQREPYINKSYVKIQGQPDLKNYKITTNFGGQETYDFEPKNTQKRLGFYTLKTLLEAVISRGEPMIANDLKNDSIREGKPLDYPPLNAFLGIPFYSPSQKLVGIVGIANCPKGYDEELIQYLQPFLATCANIIEAYRNNRRRQEVEKELRESEARSRLFTDITLNIRESLQLNKILQATVTEIQKILEVERILIYQVFANGTGRVVFEEVKPGWKSILNIDFPEDVFPLKHQQTYYNGQAKAISDVNQAYGEITPCLLDFAETWQIKAKLIVPILQDNNIWGFMIAHQCSAPRDWKQFEIELLQQIAIQVGTALSHAELLERQKELNELKSRFISMASHEFRTPLTWIASSAGILEDYGDRLQSEKKQKHLSRIQSSVQYMTQLLNDVLTISRSEVYQLEYNPTSFELVEFCSDLVEELQTSTHQNQINFSAYHADYPQDEVKLIPVFLDEKLLRQILINLLTNAIKYSPKAESINFEIIRQEQEVIFKIQDYGIGIPLADQSRIFQSFHRANNVGTIAGTGLGLAIVKNCVEVQGGEITFESRLGEGTIFQVKLPRILPSRIEQSS